MNGISSVLKIDFCFIHETNTFIIRGPVSILSAQCIVGSSANVNIPTSFTPGKFVKLEADSLFIILKQRCPQTRFVTELCKEYIIMSLPFISQPLHNSTACFIQCQLRGICKVMSSCYVRNAQAKPEKERIRWAIV